MTFLIFLSGWLKNGCLCFGVTAGDCPGARQQRPPGCPTLVRVLAGGHQIRRFCSGKQVCRRFPKFRMKIRVRRCGGGGEALLWKPQQRYTEQNVPPCNFTARQIPHLQNLDAPNRIKRRSHRCCFSKGPKLQQMPAKGSSHKERFSFFFFPFSRVCSHPGAVCQSPSEYTLHRLEHLEVRSSLIII